MCLTGWLAAVGRATAIDNLSLLQTSKTQRNTEKRCGLASPPPPPSVQGSRALLLSCFLGTDTQSAGGCQIKCWLVRHKFSAANCRGHSPGLRLSWPPPQNMYCWLHYHHRITKSSDLKRMQGNSSLPFASQGIQGRGTRRPSASRVNMN